MIYINCDFRVSLISNETLTGSVVKVGSVSPGGVHRLSDPTSIGSNVVILDITKNINTVPGGWRFWLEVTKGNSKADSSEVIVTIINH